MRKSLLIVLVAFLAAACWAVGTLQECGKVETDGAGEAMTVVVGMAAKGNIGIVQIGRITVGLEENQMLQLRFKWRTLMEGPPKLKEGQTEFFAEEQTPIPYHKEKVTLGATYTPEGNRYFWTAQGVVTSATCYVAPKDYQRCGYILNRACTIISAVEPDPGAYKEPETKTAEPKSEIGSRPRLESVVGKIFAANQSLDMSLEELVTSFRAGQTEKAKAATLVGQFLAETKKLQQTVRPITVSKEWLEYDVSKTDAFDSLWPAQLVRLTALKSAIEAGPKAEKAAWTKYETALKIYKGARQKAYLSWPAVGKEVEH